MSFIIFLGYVLEIENKIIVYLKFSCISIYVRFEKEYFFKGYDIRDFDRYRGNDYLYVKRKWELKKIELKRNSRYFFGFKYYIFESWYLWF